MDERDTTASDLYVPREWTAEFYTGHPVFRTHHELTRVDWRGTPSSERLFLLLLSFTLAASLGTMVALAVKLLTQ